MKKTIMLLVMLLSLTAAAQTLTESEKQAALKCATDFCSLLTRFSNGERTLDTQINNLCSGADCSAFDDIKTDKETTLRNYLLAIQARYPQSLPMTITPPTLAKSRVYGEPDISMSQSWGSVSIYEAEMTELHVDDYVNKYLVFDVRQTYPDLGRSVDKKLIYDANAQKITAFIDGEGSYMLLLRGLDAFVQSNYQQALYYAERAVQNPRSSLAQRCYSLAWASAMYKLDLEKVAKFGELLGDKFIGAVSQIIYLQNSGRFSDMQPYIRQLENIVMTDKSLTSSELGNGYMMLGNAYSSPSYSWIDMSKGLSYLKKAVEYGNAQAGFLIYAYYRISGEDYTSRNAALSYLLKSAELGFPTSCFLYAGIMEDADRITEAKSYYLKAAQGGNPMAMASYGRLLMKGGDTYNGRKWLRKALEDDFLDEKIEESGYGRWPETREDITDLLEDYDLTESTRPTETAVSSPSSTASSYTPSYSQSSAPSSTSASSASSSSSYNYSGYSSYRGSSHHFNYAKDDYCMGLSIGYVRKEWVYDYGDAREKLDIFWEDQYTNGIQAGLRVDCQFGYGLGLDSGLYYEYYSDKGNRLVEDDIEYYYRMKEHALYLPVHFKYNLNFSRWFQLGLYTGLGFDYGVSGKYLLYCGSEELDSFSIYDKENDLKRFNASFEYGASVRMRRLQINFTMARGLVNMSGHDDYTVKQNKTMSLSASLCF